MHPAQRRALLAIITMIEQALFQLKGILLAPEEAHIPPQAIRTPGRAPSPPASQQYLSDQEEEEFDKQLEAERLQMEKDRANQLAALYATESNDAG